MRGILRAVMTGSEAEMVRQAIAGDREGLTRLLEQYGPMARQRLAGRIPKRWQSVLSEDDVMQQTYVDAVRDIHRFVPQGEGAFLAWLVTLGKRNLLDAIRMLEAEKRGGGRVRVEARPRSESFVALYDMLGAVTSTPSRKVARAEAADWLEQAIESLPGAYRQAVQMLDIEGRSSREVAASLDRSIGAVYMLRARAHRLLGEMLGTGSRYFSDSP